MIPGPSAPSSQWGQAWAWAARSQAQWLSLPGALGGSAMSGRTQSPEAGCCPGLSQPLLFTCYQWEGEKPGAESPIKTPGCARDLGPSKYSRGDSTCRGSAKDRTQGQPSTGMGY